MRAWVAGRFQRRAPWRVQALWIAGAALLAISPLNASAAHAQTYVVTTTNDSGAGSLREAIIEANATPGSTIAFASGLGGATIALAGDLPAITSSVTINGGGIRLDGNGTYRGLFVYSGTVQINDLTVRNAVARGGNGGSGSDGGGGAGAGLGGALFVAQGASVTVSNVSLQGNAAMGGNGGNYGAGGTGGGGGGGLGGNGGNGTNAGGGGGGGVGGNGGAGGSAGSPGIIAGASPGGTGTGGAAGGAGAGGGSGGNWTATLNQVGNGGGGGVGGASPPDSYGPAGNGGFGGGGGGSFNSIGGNGGFGGGGGSGRCCGAAGNGGFGGGGGGASGNVPGAGGGGLGGFGAGSGGDDTHGGGGGGLGAGGAIFVMDGGSLAIAGNLAVNGSTVGGGTGGNGAGNGSAYGTGLFLQGNGTLTFQPGAGLSQTVSDAIADQTGSGGTGANAGSWALSKGGDGTLLLSGANTYTGGTTVTGGLINFNAANNFGSGLVTLNGGGLQWASGTATDISSRLAAIGGGGATFDTNSNNVTFASALTGTGGITKTGAGTLVLAVANSYQGGTTINGGTLAGGAANVLSAASATSVDTGGILDLGGFAQTINAVSLAGGMLKNGLLTGAVTSTGGTISGLGGSASLTTTAGTTIIASTDGYTGATTVNGGTLRVDGTITGTSAVSVNSGGILTGNGTIDPLMVTINGGGMLMPGIPGTPGTFTTIIGNLALQSGAQYLVQLNPTTSSFANVTGTATLGGATANALFANGSYIAKQYTILSATGGVFGTFAPTVANANLPANLHTTLSYDANNAYLNLVLNFAIPGGLNGNQQAVGNALTNFFNTTGGIPTVYSTLSSAALTQASGETATGSQQTTFSAMGQFMGLLTDPFTGRNGTAGSPSGAPGFAEEDVGASAYASRGGKRADAFAMFTKAPPRAPFEQRWSVWTAGFGGAQSTDGNAATGSNDATSRIFGTAVGADYLFSPNTIAGFALAGGGTNFIVNNLGSGRSDLFQAGAYVRHTNGPAYISAAAAYGWQDIITDRLVTIAGVDHLRAEFNANAWSGRVEGGYRFVAPWTGGIGITPYAAGQFTTFDLPAYAEQVISGASAFALAYASKSVTDTRSELGLRTDKSFAMQDGILTLRGRLGWAHDFNPDRSIAATFQALPGASFVVNGAAQASDSALTTASAEMKWLNGWSAAATFEGEFSDVTRSYAGKGVMRYAW
jgi:uncharacterized protein with beta-barrel porin domain